MRQFCSIARQLFTLSNQQRKATRNILLFNTFEQSLPLGLEHQ